MYGHCINFQEWCKCGINIVPSPSKSRFVLWGKQTFNTGFPSDLCSCHFSSVSVKVVPMPSHPSVTSQALSWQTGLSMICLGQSACPTPLSLYPAWHPVLQHQPSTHTLSVLHSISHLCRPFHLECLALTYLEDFHIFKNSVPVSFWKSFQSFLHKTWTSILQIPFEPLVPSGFKRHLLQVTVFILEHVLLLENEQFLLSVSLAWIPGSATPMALKGVVK